MGGILSGISGYFSKQLILGTFLPAVIFVFFGWILVVPSLPTSWPILRPVESLDPQWKILVFSFLTIVLTGFLYNVNVPLVRLYEGYPWRESWIGLSRAKKYQKLFRIAQAQWKGLPYIEYQLYLAKDPRLSAIQRAKAMAGGTLFSDFPEREEMVLPTRLGNVIRSFEAYSLRQYGMDAVAFWPRLVAEIPKDYAATVDDAKTSFDFMLNCSTLSGLLSFVTLLTGLFYPSRFNHARTTVVWVAEIVTLYAMAFLFYRLSIGRARAWGNTVRTSFDLYRRDLLKRLSYTQVPESLEAERRLWRNIGKRMIFGDQELPHIAFGVQQTFVESNPDLATLRILRGLMPAETTSGEVSIAITIRNIGIYDASELLVTDTLPPGFVYRYGSAVLANPDNAGHVMTVSGTNPYTFNVGKLSREKELVLSYRALTLRDKPPVINDENKDESSTLVFSGQMMAYHQTGNTTEDVHQEKE